jgi:CBS domain-containing protein
MRIGEVMTRRVETIEPSATADAAYERMRVKRIRHLVVMESRNVVGVLSERDLGGKAGTAVRAGRTVAELMSRGVAIAGPLETIRAAANRMRGGSVGCLPVVDDGRVVGILTVSDVLELVGRGAEKPIEMTQRRILRRRGPRREGAKVRKVLKERGGEPGARRNQGRRT